MEPTQGLRTRLRQWRQEQGLTIDEVAALTGVSPSMLSLVERGRRELAPMTRVQVARRLRVPLRDLFGVEPLDLPDAQEPVSTAPERAAA